MKLTDADAIYKLYCDLYEGNVPDGELDRMEYVLQRVKTIDATLTVHGKWIMDGNENPYIRICSVCGYSRPRMNDHGFYCKTNYCPNCGAKMDGGIG